MTSLLFYFSSANLLSFSLPALILWEFDIFTLLFFFCKFAIFFPSRFDSLGIFSETQSGSGFCAEIFVTLLNAFM